MTEPGKLTLHARVDLPLIPPDDRRAAIYALTQQPPGTEAEINIGHLELSDHRWLDFIPEIRASGIDLRLSGSPTALHEWLLQLQWRSESGW